MDRASPHPMYSWKCRSSNQVVWLCLEVYYIATVLAFKSIGLSFLPMAFQHMDSATTQTLFKIWQIQLKNISPHPASSWKCSNQVIWLRLKVCHIVTALTFKCIGFSFFLTGFQHMDSTATQTLCWKYFPPRFDILVHPCPSLHVKHILTVMQMKDVCVMLKRCCCQEKEPKSLCKIESFNKDVLSQGDEKWNEWAFMTHLSFKCYYVCKWKPLITFN